MDEFLKYFQALGLHPNASPEDVKQAYRDLAHVWHPDRFLNNPRLQQKADEKMKEINRAYEILKDLPSRSGYVNHHKEKPAGLVPKRNLMTDMKIHLTHRSVSSVAMEHA